MVEIIARLRWAFCSGMCIIGMLAVSQLATAAHAWQPPPRNKNVTISNGGLSVTFNIAWGAVVVGIYNKHVAHGLNIVDYHDVGRELQVDEFLFRNAPGRQPQRNNPTQAGALGHQAYRNHPHGSVFPERGSRVVRWKAGRHHFSAIIRPLDYDSGNATHWEYTEDVAIDHRGVAHFHFVFHRNGIGTFRMSTEIPTLYSDRTDAFMYPTVSPYSMNAASRKMADLRKRPPVHLVKGSPNWANHHHLVSKGWIANIDTRDHIGIFYTTPVGLPEAFGCFANAAVSDRLPLGKSNVVGVHLLCTPHETYSVRFSVLVATPAMGPKLIALEPPAKLQIANEQTPPPQH